MTTKSTTPKRTTKSTTAPSPHDWLVAAVKRVDVKGLGSYTRVAHAIEDATVKSCPVELLNLAHENRAERVSAASKEWKSLTKFAAQLLDGAAKPADVPMIANLAATKANGNRDDYVARGSTKAKAKGERRSSSSDADVRAFVDAFLAEHPTKGWTFALRTLRALGGKANYTTFRPVFEAAKAKLPKPSGDDSTKAKRSTKRTTKAPAAKSSTASKRTTKSTAKPQSAKAQGTQHAAAKRSEARRAAKRNAA